MSLQDAAVEWLHAEGAMTVENLATAIRREGYRPRRTSLDELHVDKYDVVRRGDLLVSTVPDNPLLVAFAALRQQGIDDPRDLAGGIRRAFRGGQHVRSIGSAKAADETLAVYYGLALDIHDLDTSTLNDDKRVVEFLRGRPGGICSTKELGAVLQSIVESSRFQLGYSPLLEMVGSGLYGVRGAPIDVLAAARQRSRTRHAWSHWGRLDRRRLWVEVKSSGEDLRARIPNDCLDVIDHGRQPLVSLTGSPLGSLVLDRHDVHIDWTHSPPVDWDFGERSAVIEFELRDQFVRLLTGVSTMDDADPRYVDGCVLHNGRWRAVVDVDTALIETRGCLVPKAVDGLSDLSEGERRDFISGDGTVTVTCEPHAFRVQIPRSDLLPDNGNLRIDFDGDDCSLHPLEPAPDLTAVILHAVGLPSPATRPWPAIGATLGLAGADYLDVARRFADRGRFDLAQLARTAPFANVEKSDPAGHSDEFELGAGQLVHLTSNGKRYARRVAGSGPLGLQWKPVPDPVPDATWAELTLLILRAWAAASHGSVDLRRTEDGWAFQSEHRSTLVESLRQIAKESGRLPSARCAEPCVATSGFAARQALASGETLTRLEITGTSWRSVSHSGAVVDSTPLRALLSADTSLADNSP
jgi:hypothetical protein